MTIIESLYEQANKPNELKHVKTKVFLDNDEYYRTGLGRITVKNHSGNMQLQQEIEDFFTLLMHKYK